MVNSRDKKLGEVWKVQEGSKNWWYVKLPKGVMSFTTKKMATKWSEQVYRDISRGIIKVEDRG